MKTLCYYIKTRRLPLGLYGDMVKYNHCGASEKRTYMTSPPPPPIFIS